MPTSILVNGASGRMGRRILAIAAADPEFTVVGGIDRKRTGTLRDLGIESDAPLTPSLPARPGTVIIDFSNPECFAAVAAHAASAGMPFCCGTTGITLDQAQAVLTPAAAKVPVLHAMNTSVGVNVLLQTAATLARTLGPDYDIEITEVHHNQKKDAPSGTAFALADAITAATGRTRADLVHGREGTAPRRPGEIGMHALRLGDVVGDHTVYFVGKGERILLGHVAHSRDIFARGALRAAAFLASQKPGRYTMANVLGL
jgi:4-hydroxy-tetrahydrodipicolinate reductase